MRIRISRRMASKYFAKKQRYIQLIKSIAAIGCNYYLPCETAVPRKLAYDCIARKREFLGIVRTFKTGKALFIHLAKHKRKREEPLRLLLCIRIQVVPRKNRLGRPQVFTFCQRGAKRRRERAFLVERGRQ